jgi:gamma-glutamylcyclotransferase (GGCT)/AIG2-like uncharacterized protein YtfP
VAAARNLNAVVGRDKWLCYSPYSWNIKEGNGLKVVTSELIFVYGTLRKQISLNMHHLIAGHSEYFSNGTLRGTLYDVCGYPGAIESSDANDKVLGELYKMLDRKRVLALLDDYEECSERFPKPHEYSRKQLSIELLDGGSVVAWVYLYNHDVSKLQQIIPGDYLGG